MGSPLWLLLVLSGPGKEPEVLGQGAGLPGQCCSRCISTLTLIHRLATVPGSVLVHLHCLLTECLTTGVGHISQRWRRGSAQQRKPARAKGTRCNRETERASRRSQGSGARHMGRGSSKPPSMPCMLTSTSTCDPRWGCPKGNTILVNKEWGIARPHNQNVREDAQPTRRPKGSLKRQSRSQSRRLHRYRPDRSDLMEGTP
ncbi:hypothetical protein NDU88_008120 [Pleurodeles waltl]|uniref:Uncharacterized protein n=1 Tax=Pleurodeles waltl TaxID=8319 RepID=A0AAV7VUJ9_PLEWA|nr:hypothetical protein NDU88_008120 [Pleurodeles waltl]